MATPSTDEKRAADSPAYEHPDYTRMKEAWRDCRDLFAGTRAIHAGGPRYLPQHPGEDPEDYKRRATATELYNAFARTVLAMAGLVFQRDPELTDGAPPSIARDWENIDGAGTHAAVFARRLFIDALQTGLGGILVDYPPVADPDAVTVADERAAALRPYWIHVRAEDVLNWRWMKKGGSMVLQQLTIKETGEEPDGAFGVCEVERFRVYRRPLVQVVTRWQGKTWEPGDAVEWEVWESRASGGSGEAQGPTRVGGGTIRNQQGIPFSGLVMGNSAGNWYCTPPLLDLGDVNLAHYRVKADRRHIMHLACVPVPVRKGYLDRHDGGATTQKIAPNVMLDLPAEGDFAWAEVTGSGIAPTGEELQKLEVHMGNLGHAFLAPDTRAAETAEGKRMDKAAESATLASCVRGLRDCLENAAKFHGAYVKEAPAGVSVNTEFEQVVLDTATMDSFARMEQAGQLHISTFHELLKQGHRLPEDFDSEKEVEKIMASGVRAAVDPETGEPIASATTPGAAAGAGHGPANADAEDEAGAAAGAIPQRRAA